MNTEEINRLEAAVESGERESSFADEYPAAPEWAVELHEQLQQNEQQIDEIERRKEAKAEAWKSALVDGAEKMNQQVASLAAHAGIATDDEKALAKSGAPSDVDDDEQRELTEAERLLIPKSERHRLQ